jgi:large-conductance mechanosensitive channel
MTSSCHRWGDHRGRCFLQHVHPSERENYDSLVQARQAGAPTINYDGVFINNVISFIIVAFVLFMVVKGIEPAVPQAGGRARFRAAAVARGAIA